MILSHKIAQNTIIHTIGRAISTIIALIVVAIMTRSLGPEGFGGYSTIIAFLQFFGITVDFGLTLTANRMLSALPKGRSEESNKLLSNLMTLRLVSAIIFLILGPVIALSFPYSLIVKQGMFIASISFFAIILGQTLVPVFQKELRMGYVAISEIAGRLALLIGVMIVAILKLDLLWFLVAVAIGSIVQYYTIRWAVTKFVKIKLSFDFKIWNKIIVVSWPIGISIIFNLIYLKADTIILSVVRSQSEVGFYGASYRVIDQFTALATMFIGLVLPPLTAAWVSNNKEKFKQIFQSAFDVYSIIAFPLLVGALLVGRPIMSLIAGKEFSVSGALLGIHMIAMVGVFFSTLFGHIVVVIEKQKKMIWGYVATAIFALIIYPIAIIKYGMFGAAWATVFTEFLITVLTFLMVWKTTKLLPELNVFYKSILSAVIMGIFLYILNDSNLAILIIGAILIYGVSLYLFGGIKKEVLKEVFSSK